MRPLLSASGTILLCALLTTLLASCGQSHRLPVAPPSTESAAAAPPKSPENPVTTKRLWGVWSIQCRDAENGNPPSAEAVPFRSGEAHFNVTGFVLPPKCVNCMDVTVLKTEGLKWTLKVTLTNPTLLTAYDVMGIFPGSAGPTILNYDSLTDLFDIDGFSDTHHPFKCFETGAPKNQWNPGESHDQVFTFRKEAGEKFTDLIYVVAASWPHEQDEVVALLNPQVSGPLYTDTSNPVTFSVQVLDWQEDIEYVLINLEPVNGSAYTHMQDTGNGIYKLYSYAAWGLTPGTKADLLIAAKSLGADYLTYNTVSVEVKDPPPVPSNWAVVSGPTTLSGPGAPTGELDLAVAGQPGGSSSTFVSASSTTLYAWDETYSESELYLILKDPTGSDPDFPIEPVGRIAVPLPVDPFSPDKFAVMLTNGDSATWDSNTVPPVLYRNTLQLIDVENLAVFDFKLTADKQDTPELDSILRPADVCRGMNANKYGYALWVPDGGAHTGYYPYAAVVRYSPPYKDTAGEYDDIIGAAQQGSGDAKVNPADANGLAVWDKNGDSNLFIVVSEGGSTEEVEIFQHDFSTNPAGFFNPVATIKGLPGTPLDVSILPAADAGLSDENLILILTDSGTIEAYTFSGTFVESFIDADAISSTPRHMDVDTVNLRVHVIMEGPAATVIQYTGEGQ